jgi:UDP-N-acetylmuramoyl-L-alanyl-D-glutamate--2,6-diaminopimelate ligase
MQLFRSIYHFFLAWLGSVIYKHPSRKLFVIGVTGTKGKSTVIELINAILETASRRTALISSVRIKVADGSKPNLTGMSMPGRFYLQKFLKKAVDLDCQYAIIEVTSQGVLQYRDRFIDFNAAVLTNLEPEHIEAHGSFEKYRDSKVKFFENVAKHSVKPEKIFLINNHARDAVYFIRSVEKFGKTFLYSKEDIAKIKLKTKLIGEFNLENIAAAVAFARSQKIDWEIIKNAIESFSGVPGRLEFVQKDPFAVVIDYAHTPDSLEKVYQTLKTKSLKLKAGKLICVLGAAGGGRDVWKRPVMGEIAAKYCDQIILTNEDPFDEDPAKILSDIKSGISKSQFPISNLKEILDRREAIRAAIRSAKKGDTVIITGKGSESAIRIAGGKKIPWNEKEVVAKILNNERIEI